MIKFNIGAKSPIQNDGQSDRLNAANDLVRRTLAQHGLMPQDDGATTSQPLNTPLDMTSFLARFSTPLGQSQVPEIKLPDGAQFRQEVFTCSEGSRPYRIYVPSNAAEGVTGLVVMLHGCTQNPEDFATGTGMNALAETHRLIVVYPQQSRGENAQSCWNWFRRGDQRRDRGEPAILAGITRKVMAEYEISNDHVYVAGLSAGAAMAVILGETYPDLFAAVGVHSGLPYEAAKDVPSAFAAMAGNVDGTSGQSKTTPSRPTIIFQGSADMTVHPSNATRIAQDVTARGAQQTIETETPGKISGRSFLRKTSTTQDGVPQLEHWLVDGLGHAWSGGQPGGSYTDVTGPDASAEMVRFFQEISAR